MERTCNKNATSFAHARGRDEARSVSPYLNEVEHRLLQTVSGHSVLTEWLCSLFDREQVELLMAQYGIGADDEECTVLSYIDRQGSIADMRVVAYDLSPLTLPDPLPVGRSERPYELSSRWMHEVLGYPSRPMPLCLFGEEMVGCMPEASIGLVHDEVEVLLARLWRPDMAWVCLPHGVGLNLSCPSSLDILAPLAERDVLLWPRAGRLQAAQQMVSMLTSQLHMRVTIPNKWQRVLSGKSPPRSLGEVIIASSNVAGNEE